MKVKQMATVPSNNESLWQSLDDEEITLSRCRDTAELRFYSFEYPHSYDYFIHHQVFELAHFWNR